MGKISMIKIGAVLLGIFFFGGCGEPNRASPVNQESSKNNNRCSLEPKVGKCRAAIVKYYFDTSDNKCKSFIWGGCGGVVPFDNFKNCTISCKE